MIAAQLLKPLHAEDEAPQTRLWVGRQAATLADALRACWQRVRSVQQALQARSERRTLRVTESVSLGDKRSVHLIEVDGQRILLGASAAGVTLLSQLPSAKESWRETVKELVFADVLESCGSTKKTNSATKQKVSAVRSRREDA